MKATRYLSAILLSAAMITGVTAFCATTGELLQQGLYAEEVEGNMESAIKAYGQVINNGSAPANHVAQALYRQGMCYLKMKDETSARAALERLVSQHSGETDLVNKALPLLEDLTDFDPASLMPPGTLAYLELGSPGRQIETLLAMLKGTPFENPLATVSGQPSGSPGQKSPGDIVGALLNPAMMTEFKKIRSSAVGIMGVENNQPRLVCVLYPGKSDALRGILLAALGMAGKPGDALEGMQTVLLPEDMAVAHDERVVIMARPAKQLEWSVKKYKGKISDAALATSNASFSKLNKSQRQKNVMTLWANVDEAYAQIIKLIPGGQMPPQLLVANAVMDFNNIDDLIITQSLETNGVADRLEIQFKDGHHCLAYDLMRTPNLNKAALAAAPSDAVAVAGFALSQSAAGQAERVRSQVQNITGLDIGREIFANIEQVTLFAMPALDNTTNAFLPGRFGLALTSRDPAQTRQVIDTLLATINPVSPGQKSDDSKGVKISRPGQPDRYCHIRQANNVTLLSLDRAVAEASMAAVKNQKSAATAGVLSQSVNRLSPDASKVILLNAGGAIRLIDPIIRPATLNEEQAKQWTANLDELARAAAGTVIEYRTEERLNRLALNHTINGLPPLHQIIGPVAQLNGIINETRADAAAEESRRSKPAIVMPAARPPAIDGNEDDVWSNASRYPLNNVASSFGSGERAGTPASPEDLSAEFRALWDEKNLYLLVNVTDDKLVADTVSNLPVTVPSGSSVVPWWYDDSIEIYLDADNAKSEQYGANDAQIRLNWNQSNPSIRIYNQNVEKQLPGVEFAMVTTATGYRAEIKLPWAAFDVKPSTGAGIGLDVHVNDDDNGGERDKKITWHDTQDNCWQSPRSFGNAELAGLVGWWKLDESQGDIAADSSGDNNNGVLVGGARWAKGTSGSAIDLNGDNAFVRIPDKRSFDFGGAVSVACWVNFRSDPADWAGIVTKGDSAWRLSCVGSERRLHFSVGDYTRSGNDAAIDSPTTLNTGEWHHVAGTYDGSTVRLYLDGKLDVSKTWTGGLARNQFEVLIGSNAQRQGRAFNGLVDDVRIYNYALTESDIQSLAAARQ